MIEYSIIPELLKNAIHTLSTGNTKHFDNFSTHKTKKQETIIRGGPAEAVIGELYYKPSIDTVQVQNLSQVYKDNNYTAAHRYQDTLIFYSKSIDINSIDDKDYTFNLIIEGIQVHHIELISVLSTLVIPREHVFFLRVDNLDSYIKLYEKTRIST